MPPKSRRASKKRPSAALHSSCVIATYGVRLIPQDFVRLASGLFLNALEKISEKNSCALQGARCDVLRDKRNEEIGQMEKGG